MENLFASAKFGDKYCTRDGRMAIYIKPNYYLEKPDGSHWMILEHSLITSRYSKCGSLIGSDKCSHDIVSRWVESINEEELDKLALEYNDGSLPNDFDYRNGFKDGYHKAKQEYL